MKTKQKTAALLGFGRSNGAVLDYLAGKGYACTVYSEAPLRETDATALAARGIEVSVGKFPLRFSEALLVRSPGLRPDRAEILASVEAGSVLTDETALMREALPVPLFGITGSDGKTTTANLVSALLAGAGYRAFLGGNNGVPLLPRIGEMRAGDFAVAELSSFQLMTLPRAADYAVITNVTPNHLNWHVDMTEYQAAKCRIFGKETYLVLNAENEITRRIAAARAQLCPIAATVLFAIKERAVAGCADAVFPREGAVIYRRAGREQRFDCLADFRLPGRHNLENLLAALALTLPITGGAGLKALCEFSGVPHRLQRVAAVAGVTYINSSIDTSPTRTAAALSALGGRPLVIVGGRGKGISFAPLGDALAARAKAVFLYGEAAEEIATAIGGRVPLLVCDRFAEAFWGAARAAERGDTVLLSPGCTAFGEFRDFEERGETFCRLVEEAKNFHSN